MFIKLFLTVVLSLSVPCFAESNGNKSKALIDINQKTQSSIQQTQSSQSESPAKKENSQSTQDSNAEKKPSMIDYCRKHTC